MTKKDNIWKGITKENKKLIQDYIRHRDAQGKRQKTLTNEELTLRKIARYFNPKSLKEMTKKELQTFFKTINNVFSRDLYATHIVNFDQWAFDLERRERSKRMKWYIFRAKTEKRKQMIEEEKIKQFITREEYEQLIGGVTSIQSRAMWQTMYLSSARNGELLSMKINSVKEIEKGWEIILVDSKTIPRNNALPEAPTYLLQWVRSHPNKDKPDSPLWVSESRRNYGRPLNPKRVSTIDEKLECDMKRAKFIEKRIKEISPKNFRATRATIMFGAKSKDGGLIYSDSDMAIHFGWSVDQVPQRRIQYDLTGYKDLKEKIFAKSIKPKDLETLEEENRKLRENTDIDELNKKIEELESHLETARRFARTTEKDRLEMKKIKEEFETRFNNIEKNLHMSLNPETPQTQNTINYMKPLLINYAEKLLNRKFTNEELEEIDEGTDMVLNKLNKLPADEISNLVKPENVFSLYDNFKKKKSKNNTGEPHSNAQKD